MRKEQLNADSVFVIHDFLTAEECAGLIALSEQTGYEEASITTGTGFVMIKEVRNNDRVIRDDPVLATQWWQRAQPYLPAEWFGWQAVGFNERFRFYRYDPGQKFAPHSDGYFERANGERSQFTFMVYLNDDFEGGNTNFLAHRRLTPSDLRIVPVKGLALVFMHRQLHEGAPVLKGRKYVLRTDVMYYKP